MDPHFANNGLLASLAPTPSTSTIVGTKARDEDASGKGFVDALAEEDTGTVALVRDGDGNEEDEDEGGKETIKVDVCAHERILRVIIIIIIVARPARWRSRARRRGCNGRHDVVRWSSSVVCRFGRLSSVVCRRLSSTMDDYKVLAKPSPFVTFRFVRACGGQASKRAS